MSFGSDLREQLKSNVMEVKFTKVNELDEIARRLTEIENKLK